MKNTEQDNTFTIINDEGKEIKCEILFTYENEETGVNYMAYTDNTTDEEGNTKVYASIFDPNEEDPILLPIETEEEWMIIEQILMSLSENDNEKCDSISKKSVVSQILNLLNDD